MSKFEPKRSRRGRGQTFARRSWLIYEGKLYFFNCDAAQSVAHFDGGGDMAGMISDAEAAWTASFGSLEDGRFNHIAYCPWVDFSMRDQADDGSCQGCGCCAAGSEYSDVWLSEAFARAAASSAADYGSYEPYSGGDYAQAPGAPRHSGPDAGPARTQSDAPGPAT